MGFLPSLSSITHSISNAVGNVGRAVASAATGVINNAKGILSGITDGFIGSIASGLKNVVGNLPMVGGLLSNLINKGQEWAKGALGQLMSGGFASLQNFVQGLISQVTGRVLENGASVAPPPLSRRFDAANLATTQQAVNTAAQAATGAASSTGVGSDNVAQEIRNLAGGRVTGQQLASKYGQDYSDPEIKKQFDMMAIQKNESMMQQLFQMISTIAKNRDDTAMSIIRNMKA